MILRLNLTRKLTAQLARLTPTQTPAPRRAQSDKPVQQDLYESIALGNALAEAEAEADRLWRGR